MSWERGRSGGSAERAQRRKTHEKIRGNFATILQFSPRFALCARMQRHVSIKPEPEGPWQHLVSGAGAGAAQNGRSAAKLTKNLRKFCKVFAVFAPLRPVRAHAAPCLHQT